jgi:hypothetical protein
MKRIIGEKGIDVYNKPIVSMLEPLEEPFVDGSEISDIKNNIKDLKNDYNRVLRNYTNIRDLSQEIKPKEDAIYPESHSDSSEKSYPPDSLYANNSYINKTNLKMQHQKDIQDMIRGSSNLIVIMGISFTTITIFTILSFI